MVDRDLRGGGGGEWRFGGWASRARWDTNRRSRTLVKGAPELKPGAQHSAHPFPTDHDLALMRWCNSIRCMRTTLDIEDDVLQAAKELAQREGSTAGQVISALARRGGPLLASRGEMVTLEHIQDLMDQEGV